MAKPLKKEKRKPASTNSFGRELMEGVRQMHDAVSTGDLSGFKVRQVEVPEPSKYGPSDVRSLRDELRLTQAMFGRIVGVSTETIEHWEQGIRRPAASARRLMDQIKSRPDEFVLWLMRNSLPGSPSGSGAARELAKAEARAYLKLAAKVLSRKEMALAVQETYSEIADEP